MDDKELERILAEIRNRNSLDDSDNKNTIPPQKPKEHISFDSAQKLEKNQPVNNIEAPKPSIKEEPPASDVFNIIESESDNSIENNINETAASEGDALDGNIEFDDKKPKNKKLKYVIIALVVLIIIALGAGIFFASRANKAPEPATTTEQTTKEETTEEVTGALNPLTGERGYNAKAVGKRPVAVVVENEYTAESVRPQWGIADADIVMEAETEFSTRMLFFWADYTKMPEQIGPTRSARPPFIRFSQLFDSVFIHAGLSRSKGNYEGADSVFENEGVDHINLLNFDETGNFFGRDRSRGGAVEHTGYLNGNNTEALLEKEKIDTDLNENKFTRLSFNKKAKKLSENSAEKINFIWSDPKGKGHCPKTGKFEYDEEEKKYTTFDYDSSNGEANVEFENLIFLLDETEYIVKENYKSAGNSETYCDYKLSGGKGVVASEGTYVDITWSVENGKLSIKNQKGKELKLNPGKIYIGYGSSNHGGKITINPED